MSKGKKFIKRRNYTHKNYLEQGIRGGFHDDGEYDLQKGYTRKSKHKNKFNDEIFDLLEVSEDLETVKEEPVEVKTEESSS